MIYVTSDVHGRLDRLKRLIDKIGLSDHDKLYILGDLVDRGEEPIESIEFVMTHPNSEVLMGNHDEMMLQTLRYKKTGGQFLCLIFRHRNRPPVLEEAVSK